VSAERLAVGDRVLCPKCRRWHPADRESSGSATDYAERMLFIRCGPSRFYVGQVGGTTRKLQDVRCRVAMTAWTLTLDGHFMTCQIRQDVGGWDTVLYLDGETLFAQRCYDEAHATFVANGLKLDEERAGWA